MIYLFQLFLSIHKTINILGETKFIDTTTLFSMLKLCIISLSIMGSIKYAAEIIYEVCTSIHRNIKNSE